MTTSLHHHRCILPPFRPLNFRAPLILSSMSLHIFSFGLFFFFLFNSVFASSQVQSCPQETTLYISMSIGGDFTTKSQESTTGSLSEGTTTVCINVTAPVSSTTLLVRINNDPRLPPSSLSDPTFQTNITSPQDSTTVYKEARFGRGTISAIRYGPIFYGLNDAYPLFDAGQSFSTIIVLQVLVTNMTSDYNYTMTIVPEVSSADWKQTSGQIYSYYEGAWAGTIFLADLSSPAANGSDSKASFRPFQYTLEWGQSMPQNQFYNTSILFCLQSTFCAVSNCTTTLVPQGTTTYSWKAPSPGISMDSLEGANCPADRVQVTATPVGSLGNTYPGVKGSYKTSLTPSSGKLSTGAIVGIAFGVSIAAIASVIVAVLFIKYYLRNFHHSSEEAATLLYKASP